MKIYKKYSEKDQDQILSVLENFIKDTKDDWNYITPLELHDDLKKDSNKYFLLDVRKPEDYEKFHIKGTVNIFWQEIVNQENLDKLPKKKTIVVICYVGHTASQVLVMLKLLGYKAVGLKFGMGVSPVKGVPVAGWINYGFEVEGKCESF